MSQATLSVMQGGSFEQAFWSGALRSLGASGWSAVMGTSGGAMIAFGALSGGVGAELSGGNFWEGAVIGGMVAGLNHAMHRESSSPPPPEEDDWATKIVNLLSGGAVDEARAILAFEATNPSFTDKIMFRTGIALQHSTGETFGARGLGAWGNYRGRFSSGIKLSSSQIKSIKSFRVQINQHKAKLNDYIKKPAKYDNKGFLKNAPNDAVRKKIIQTRVNHLKHEIKTFENNIQKIINGK